MQFSKYFYGITALMLAALLCSSQSAAQQPRIRLGYQEPALPAVRAGAEQLRNKLGGELVPLGTDLRRSIENGEIDLAIILSSALVRNVQGPDEIPFLAVYELPFFFSSRSELEQFQASTLGQAVFASTSRNGLVALAYWHLGMTHLFGQSVHRIDGRRLGTSASLYGQTIIRNFGAEPVAIMPTSAVSAVEEDVVGLSEALPSQIAEGVPFRLEYKVSAPSYRPLVYYLVASERFWSRQSEDQKLDYILRISSIASDVWEQAEQRENAALNVLRQNAVIEASLSAEAEKALVEGAEAAWNSVPELQTRGFLTEVRATRAAIREGILDRERRRRSEAPRRSEAVSGMESALFVTDRVDEGGFSPYTRFGSRRGGLRFGTSSVQESVNLNGDVIRELRDISLFSSTHAFTDAVKARITKATSKQLMIYVHGFYTTFSHAIETAVELALDLKFRGVVIPFSWPSEGLVPHYVKDDESARFSKATFLELLREVSKIKEVEQVYVVAHSMGSKVVTDAFEWLGNQKGTAEKPVYNLIFVAPDVLAPLFAEAAPAFHNVARQGTLYASDTDGPLRCSQWLHSGRRAGQAGDDILVLPPRFDSIDVTGVEGEVVRFLPCSGGHSYFITNRAVAADLFQLVNFGIAPVQRHRLRQRKGANGLYWALK